MMRLRVLIILAALLGAVFTPSHSPWAQTVVDSAYLTEDERQDFAKRLATAFNSSDRAKVKSEMVKLIQKRKLEQRDTKSQ